MCTLAWGKNGERLWVCFNRDEKRSRSEAEPPCIHGNHGERLVYARDPVGQGSWFVASEHGFVVALLNHYPDTLLASGGGRRSRGQLVLKISRSGGTDQAGEMLKEASLTKYHPFHLFLLSTDQVVSRTWDGSSLKQLDCPLNFWTTSSHMQEQIRKWRTNWWQEQTVNRTLDAASAGTILQSRNQMNPAFGITMDRDDARTVSQIQLLMDSSGFVFCYLARDKRGEGYCPPKVLRCGP